MVQRCDHDATTPGQRARAAAIEVAGFDPGGVDFIDDNEARAAYVDARAALLWSDVDLRELDDLAARKVAAWEVLDTVHEEESHSAVRDCPSTCAMAQTLKDARIAGGLTVDDVAELSEVSRETYIAIENFAYAVDLIELTALAPAVGLTAVEVLATGQQAGHRGRSHLWLVSDQAPRPLPTSANDCQPWLAVAHAIHGESRVTDPSEEFCPAWFPLHV